MSLRFAQRQASVVENTIGFSITILVGMVIGSMAAVAVYWLALQTSVGIWRSAGVAPAGAIAILGENSPYMFYQLGDGRLVQCREVDKECALVGQMPVLDSSLYPCGYDSGPWSPRHPSSTVSVVVQHYCGGVDVYFEHRYVLLSDRTVLYWGYWAGSGHFARSDVDGAGWMGALVGLFGGLISYAFVFPDRPIRRRAPDAEIERQRQRS